MDNPDNSAGSQAPIPIASQPNPPVGQNLPPVTGAPRLVNISPSLSPASRIRSLFGSRSSLFFLGGLFVLLIGLGVGVVLVQKQQDIRSKATGCDMRWPADPATDCGKTTQLPKQDDTNVSVTPDFHWDYGGYRTEDNGKCVQPSGCGTYSAAVMLFDSSSSDRPFASAAAPGLDSTQSTPPRDVKFADFRTCDYGHVFPNDPNTCHTNGQPTISPLKPGTDYWWFVAPYFDGTVHAEQKWKYHFKTSSVAASCQMISADKDLTQVQIGDTVKFTGYGSISSASEKIDKINFILTKDNTQISSDIVDATRAQDKDSGDSQLYVATRSAQINAAGSYSMRIRIHWQSADKWME